MACADGAAAVSLYVLTVQAVAGPANAEPDGRRYDLLVFARGASEAEAEQTAERGLETLGWIERRLLRSGEITDCAAVPEDFTSTLQRAREHGCAVIVYDQP